MYHVGGQSVMHKLVQSECIDYLGVKIYDTESWLRKPTTYANNLAVTCISYGSSGLSAKSSRSSDRLDDGHMTAVFHRRWGNSYPWSRFMAGWSILISMASLTFLFNQMSSLASNLTLHEEGLKKHARCMRTLANKRTSKTLKGN